MWKIDEVISKFEEACSVSIANDNLLSGLKTREVFKKYRKIFLCMDQEFTTFCEFMFL